jgi:SAM-dependent methyltransferase
LGCIGRRKPQSDPFDSVYGTETSGIREIGTLEIESANVRHAVRYEPSSAALVRNAIEQLGLELSQFTFVDFGSGKGRTLLLAAEYPFTQVIGVEFSRELHEIARQNIEKMPPRLQRTGRVSSVWCDATEFELPRTDLVCYFYNPFGPAVLAPLAARMAKREHRTVVLYADARYPEAFEEAGFKKILGDASLTILTRDARNPPDQATDPRFEMKTLKGYASGR